MNNYTEWHDMYHHGTKGQKWGLRRAKWYPIAAFRKSMKGNKKTTTEPKKEVKKESPDELKARIQKTNNVSLAYKNRSLFTNQEINEIIARSETEKRLGDIVKREKAESDAKKQAAADKRRAAEAEEEAKRQAVIDAKEAKKQAKIDAREAKRRAEQEAEDARRQAAEEAKRRAAQEAEAKRQASLKPFGNLTDDQIRMKNEILTSGNVKQALKNKQMFTNQELSDVLVRAESEKKMNAFLKEQKSVNKKTQKFLHETNVYTSEAATFIQNAEKIYKAGKTLNAAYDVYKKAKAAANA